MSIYRVVCYRGDRWDRQEPSYVEADSAADAARKICGEEDLITTGSARDLRALVIEISNPNVKVAFFRSRSPAVLASAEALEQPDEEPQELAGQQEPP